MALGIGGSGGGDFVPYCKYDARAGRWYRKMEDGEVDCTDGFTAVFDFDGIEVGWLAFAAGAAPSMVTAPIGQPQPAKPADHFKQGFKLHLVFDGGAVHELASTARSLIGSIDRLHTEYTQAPEKAAGKLPVVKMTGTTVVETKVPGGGTTKNFAPNLEVIGWVDRPASLDAAPTSAPAAPPAPVASTPPATGSTPVPPQTPQSSGGSLNFG